MPPKRKPTKKASKDHESIETVATKDQKDVAKTEKSKPQESDESDEPQVTKRTRKPVKAKEAKEKDIEEAEEPVARNQKKGAITKEAKVDEDESGVPVNKRPRRAVNTKVLKPENNAEPARPASKRQKKPAKNKDSQQEESTDSKESKNQKKPVKSKANTKKDETSDEVPEKKSRKNPPAKAKSSATEKPPAQNQTLTKWDDIDFTNSKENNKGHVSTLKITSWNVDGIRAWLKKGGLNIIEYDDPDIFCVQETKCSDDKLPDEVKEVEGYHQYWCSSQKEGYAGVGVYTKIEPISVAKGIGNKDHDDEGRCITLEFKEFYLVNVYVPNAGRGLVTLPKRLDWNDIFKTYIKKLDEKKPVIVCGDMNVAHNEIDLTNPKTNKKNAGFTQEERDGMTNFLSDGYVDTLREFYPDQENIYTFWSYMSNARAKNIGWRIDYFICSNRIKDNICDSVIRDKVFGSDHCPLSLFLSF